MILIAIASVGWVAGAIRGRALAARTLGNEGAEALAAKSSLDDALVFLSSSTYGHQIHAGMELEAAQRAVGDTALWHLRVLAGWLPPRGVEFMKVLAAWFEMCNIEDRAVALAGGGEEPPAPYALGTLATVWRQAAEATTLSELRIVLAQSPWGDPGSEELSAILLGLRIGWSRRLREALADYPHWGDGALALVMAKALFVQDGEMTHYRTRDVRELGSRWRTATELGPFADSLPESARWVLRGSRAPEDLWLAERSWWRRVDRDARRLVHDLRVGRSCVTGAATLLVTDCSITQTSLQRAARGFGIEEAGDARA